MFNDDDDEQLQRVLQESLQMHRMPSYTSQLIAEAERFSGAAEAGGDEFLTRTQSPLERFLDEAEELLHEDLERVKSNETLQKDVKRIGADIKMERVRSFKSREVENKRRELSCPLCLSALWSPVR